MRVRPLEARRLPADRRLRITWEDGHVGDYDWAELRGWCPCAFCQGHDSQEVVYHPPAGPIELVSLEQVGNYALSFAWSDGHRSGIYRFDFLRGLCPCPLCRPGGTAPTA